MSIKILFCIILLTLTTHKIFSQPVDIDSVKAGKTYRVVLYDEREIVGKLTYADSVIIKISDDKNIYRIRKDDILSVTEDPSGLKKNYIISINGGYSVAPENQYTHTSGNNYSLTGFNIGAEAILSLVNNKKIRLVLSYTGLKKPAHTDEIILAIYPPSYNKEDESNISLISFRADYMLGDFSPANKFSYFFFGGLGFCLFRETAYKSYFIYNDTLKSIQNNRSKNIGGVLFAAGISGSYKISKNAGIQAQIEYNLITGSDVTERIHNGFIPFKLGVFFIL